MNCDKKDFALYGITDRRWLKGKTLASQVEKAIQGGAGIIQLREKNLDADSFLSEAVEIQKLCKEKNVPFIINDSVDIALKMNADGVHVGQDDMMASDVRAKLGPDKILGVTAHSVEQAVLAEKQGADYLGVGAVFQTSSKDNTVPVTMDTLREICSSVHIPVVAISGITKDNICKLAGTGISGIAVISAIFAQDDVEKAASELRAEVLKIL